MGTLCYKPGAEGLDMGSIEEEAVNGEEKNISNYSVAVHGS